MRTSYFASPGGKASLVHLVFDDGVIACGVIAKQGEQLVCNYVNTRYVTCKRCLSLADRQTYRAVWEKLERKHNKQNRNRSKENVS